MEACVVDFPDACFEFADVGPEGAQHGELANLLGNFASGLHGFSKNTIAVSYTHLTLPTIA